MPLTLKNIAGFALSLSIAFSALSAYGADLSQIQQQIKRQEQKIVEQQREKNKLQSALKQQENKINDVLGELRQTESELKETRKLIAETERQIKQLKQQEQRQKKLLAQQLDNIYRSGNPSSVIEHLLSDNSTQAERMKVYYAHMNRARAELIQDLKNTRAQLSAQKETMSSQQKAQQEQLSSRKKQQQELQKVQNERSYTLSRINKTLERDQSRLDSLKANENALRQEIQRAAQAAAAQERQEREAYARKKEAEEKKNNKPYQPTAQEQQRLRSGSGLSGKYAYPTAGKVINRFGAVQAGEVRWKGILISAAAGTPVKAISDGRVILSSWLQGYGLVVVIDHGKGDMSLYGYNRAVRVKAGDQVRAGQTIAEVGSSGGQGRSALYFEIRRQGNAVNPQNWLR
ncbi:septal ring factor EnvC (AmiA/AmiB activator) [Mesocricetibacter intestinalis]|uniref:Septal ring factor EnvC (AmiA/AmiB activator) n=1 Tax=Mesocricetibacter intestinalis TaxID=1521930 RepID=A0A4R6V8G6_9PAST|nr:murein hydrolase activator EnvC [Mesocricetibacter intestinalis]TDQ57654.1 septal ring factor EnvC (AmiA/AmiB activator) [Mesocricetibacter intestinalis]